MTRAIPIIAASVLMAAPSSAIAQSAPGQGQVNGTGYWHQTGPAEAPGPDVECGEDDALGSPGHAADAPGSAFNHDGDGGIAGQHYAGEQPQNSRNTASFSRYDVACEKVPQ
jgi:hypothetical protein